MAVTLLRVLLLGAIAAAADDVPITWWRSPPALLQCEVPDAERVQSRRPPPPLDIGERSRPKPYLWRRGDEEFKRASNGTLEVSRRNGEGVYQCAVRHHGSLVLGYPINLKFAYLDKQFSAHPENATTRAGQPYVLTCNISSGPPAAITWLRDGEPLPDDKRYHNMNNQLLIIDVKKVDAGLYRCKAVNNHAAKTRMSHISQLQVEEHTEDQDVSMLPLHVETDIYAARGSRVVLPCPLVGWPRPKLIWELTPPVGRISELEDEEEVLVLPSLEIDQEGTYTCTVEGNSDLIKTFKVTMTEPVVITVPPTSKQTVRATTIRFNCTAVGKPTPNITWYRNGVPLALSGRMAVMSSSETKRIELLIRSVTSGDGGVYQCFAQNGHSVASAWASLEVWGAEAAAPRGVRCWPAGARALTLRWAPVPATVIAYNVQTTKPGGMSLPGQPILSTEDKITVNEPLTPYMFQVRAFIHSAVNNRTVASDMSESVICQGQGVPIKLAKSGDDSVLVSWKQFVTQHPGVVQWILQYRAENSSEEHNVTLDGSVYNSTLKVSPLQPVQVRVLGSRSAAWLHQNLSLVPWTSTSAASHQLDGEVTAVPEDVEVTEISPREFTVRWRCEEADSSPETYTYMVCTRKVDGDEECVDTSSYSVTVKHLQPSTEYVVRVQARIPGRTLGGEFSAPMHITTPEEGSKRFSELTYKFINASTVRVSWNSKPDKYTVRYTNELKLPIVQWAFVETFGNTVLISGVDLTRELHVMVEGYEPLGKSSIMHIPVQVPEAKDLQYSYTDSGVFVTWKGPGPRIVRYSQNITQSLEKWASIEVNGSSVEIRGLSAWNTTYVMVAAGGPSRRTQVLTVPPPPPPSPQHDNNTLYIGIGTFIGIIVLCLIAVAAVCIWRRRKRTRSPISLRRRNLSPNEGTEEEISEMQNIGGRLANGGGSKDAGEPLLNGHVHITENPTVQQTKTPNGRMRKNRHYEPAFDVSRHEDPDATVETVLEADTSTSTTYNLLDTSRRPEYEVSRSSRAMSANNSFNKLPDDNMNSELTRSTDFELDNSKIQVTLQPNG